VLERLDHGLGDELFGQVEITEEADQTRRESARLLAEDRSRTA